MPRNISDEDGTFLDDAMEIAGAKSIQGLYEFVKGHVSEHELDFNDDVLRKNMPTPQGNLRDVFITIVNYFIKYAQDMDTYPETPPGLSKIRIVAAVAEYQQVTMKTAAHKIGALASLGWIEFWHGNIRNPVLTWYEAKENNKRHPGISREGGPTTNEIRP